MAEEPSGQVTLVFRASDEIEHADDPIYMDVSAAARHGDALFVCCDETAGVDRLTREGDAWGNHVHVALGSFLDLPDGPSGEMDIEGLVADDGWLWIVGSHALKRGKPEGGPEKSLRKMEKIKRDPNRDFLGRIPLSGEAMPVAEDGNRREQHVKLYRKTSALKKWLRGDDLLDPFLDLPSKENGLDIEGIAVHGTRAWLGLRGPVLREMAVVLELELKVTRSGHLKAKRIDDNRRYRKHLISTRGLGIRDLVLDGDDLILLVGPTMASDGVAAISRRRGATCVGRSGVVPAEDIEMVRELPYRGVYDHPEGLVHWDDGRWFVVYDNPAPKRLGTNPARLVADLWPD